MAPPASAGKKTKNQTDPTQLVWPLPPDKPRFRWVEMFQDAKQYESKKFAFVDRIVGGAKAGPETMMRPIGVATDSKGRVIISSQTNRTVYVIDKEHKQLLRLQGTQAMPLKTPMGVTVDEKDNIYVADSKLHSVLRFAADGTPNASFGEADGLNNPSYMAVDSSRHRLYVTDTHGHQVFVYNTDTLKLETKIGKRGNKKGEFGFPVGVAVSPKNGNIAVTNTESCSVEIFTPEYKWTKRIGECGNSMGDFTRPKGVAFDQEGNLYVVDNAFNNFQVFDPDGHLRMFVGTTGFAPGMFWLPNAIFVDKNNRVYVSEFYGNRVQVFQFLGSN
jgi:DNA-binding beta-propeller fold protein YncE